MCFCELLNTSSLVFLKNFKTVRYSTICIAKFGTFIYSGINSSCNNNSSRIIYHRTFLRNPYIKCMLYIRMIQHHPAAKRLIIGDRGLNRASSLNNPTTYHAKKGASKHGCDDALFAAQTERFVSQSGQQLQELGVQSVQHVGKKFMSVLLLVASKSWYDFPDDKEKAFGRNGLTI